MSGSRNDVASPLSPLQNPQKSTKFTKYEESS